MTQRFPGTLKGKVLSIVYFQPKNQFDSPALLVPAILSSAGFVCLLVVLVSFSFLHWSISNGDLGQGKKNASVSQKHICLAAQWEGQTSNTIIILEGCVIECNPVT